MKVKDILKTKGPEVITIFEEKTIEEAVEFLVRNRIGGLLVLDQAGKIAGIITERDILRESNRNYQELGTTKVKAVMTREVIACAPEDDLEYIEQIMTEKRIRHLPVIDQKRLVGVISIGDVVKTLVSAKKVEIRYLKEYIEGRY